MCEGRGCSSDLSILRGWCFEVKKEFTGKSGLCPAHDRLRHRSTRIAFRYGLPPLGLSKMGNSLSPWGAVKSLVEELVSTAPVIEQKAGQYESRTRDLGVTELPDSTLTY